jgi:REP element-mobilizing transposase RayT
MSQSLSQIYLHLVYSTKGRKPMIHKPIKDDLHAYMAGIFKLYESPALIINSVPDHIHILFRLSKNMALAMIVEQIKKSSSKWMKEHTGNKSFSWQNGYGAFSVSSWNINTITRYIERQEEHHKRVSYRQEIEKLMKENDMAEYNPEYFWD